MDLSWINVADSAVKIGLGALISAASAYVVLAKTQSNEHAKDAKAHWHRVQDEKKAKYVELLALSQELIQSHLFSSCAPDSEGYKQYLRVFNEVQIISNDAIRLSANVLVCDVQAFILLNKNEQDTKLIDNMVAAARQKVSIFQKVAQEEISIAWEKT